MRPDLVLDEDDKKRRFKKYKKSEDDPQTADGDESNDSEVSHKAVFDNKKNVITECMKRKYRNGSGGDELKDAKFQKTKPFEDKDTEEGEESDKEEEFFDFVKETMAVNDVDKIYSDLAQNESFIDPETGMVVSSEGKATLSHYKLDLRF